MPPKKRPASAMAGDDEEEPRKSRKGFKEWHKLRDALLPFIDKRFFASYHTDRAIAKIDKKKLCSPFFGILNNCRQLSPTWNFPDTVIKKALLGVLKHEDNIYCWDKARLAEQIKEADRDAWSTTNSLRLSAAFRHYSQATLRQREWVPKAGMSPRTQTGYWQAARSEPCATEGTAEGTAEGREPQDEVACEDMDGEHGADDPDHEPEKEPADNEPADNEPADNEPPPKETAAAFLANDWFLNTLDGMMGGFDPSDWLRRQTMTSYLSPTPGPSRRRETQLLESPTVEEPTKTPSKWDYEMQRACLESQTGPVFSSKPFVKEDEVFVQFSDGLMWSVPHLDYVYSIIRCKYCTQGSKNPLIKVEAREDRHDASSKWIQKLQLVIRTGLSVRKAMHIAMTFADCYVYMNLNPAEINYKGCRDDLLAHNHDWEASALDWQTVISLRLKHFPRPKESPIKIAKPTQTQIVDDQAKNEPQEAPADTASAPDAAGCDNNNEPSDATNGEEQKPADATSGEQKPTDAANNEDKKPPAMAPESIHIAIENYANSINRDPKEVTLSMLEATKEGSLYWATVNTDMSARGATAQSMGRAIRFKTDVKTLYGLLLDSYKLEFRRAWACSRDFTFATTTRSTVNTFRKRKAKNYTQMCCRDDLKEWTSTVTVEVSEPVKGSWSEKVQLSKAMRCYAAENGKRLVDVTETEVRNSELGVQGWAALFEKTPGAQPKPGGDGSNAGGGKGGKKRGLEPKPIDTDLPPEQASDNAMSTITIELGKSDPAARQWASGFVKSYKECRVGVLELYAENPFFQSMKVAVLSAKELQKVKKEYKDQYLPKLCDFVSMLGPKISAMAEASVQIQQMACAKKNASESVKASGDIEAAQKFRRLLVERLLDGSATATDTCQLAYWHVASGGEGAEDLALNPRCHLSKEFPEPDVEMVSVPMHLKKSAGRRDLSEQHPDLRLPIIDFKANWAALVEIEVTIPDVDVQQQISKLLHYRKKGRGRGRCLLKAFQQLGLPKMARLEPSTLLPDVGSFEQQQCPFSCIFYVAGEHGRVLHVSPLLQIPGVSLSSWCIDLLHTWHYGPMSTYLTFALRALLSTEIYKPGNSAVLDKEENDKLSLMALKAELWMFYKHRRATDKEWSKKGSEVGRKRMIQE
ncbi:unnamed protein product [Symbiodinium sp. CCMP2592]|nr:unnamed protein product [Symbiodinium sp. CCMP2592]